MLTLNTGQTPMSTRHQLEMLYNDMKNTEIEGVKLISDTNGSADPNKKSLLSAVQLKDLIHIFQEANCRLIG